VLKGFLTNLIGMLVWNLKREIPLGRSGLGWEDNTRTHLRRTVCAALIWLWIQLTLEGLF
jgi:hypothetical protein